ncbi:MULTISPECIES: hemerythrin domain-containing protein [Anaeromyxobacter]|uniref:hemerythrin domain-containing protein n=1 Tax=Anaeromyxobacter TaxID=161492 RepID=UPI001F5A69CE|nr:MULTISPECIES: hemerythrin domain-containing protein [unclassified Anaeromyxobacter]
MQTHTGTRSLAEEAVAVLLECHGRLRSFIELADRLAVAGAMGAEEVARAAAGIRQYFAEALPLHAQDEEESVLPRLAGRDRQVDAALVTMHRDHAGHALAVSHVLAVCSELVASPGRREELAPALIAAVATLREHFSHHLVLEEEVIFPALRTLLGDGARADIARELRARRDHSSR